MLQFLNNFRGTGLFAVLLKFVMSVLLGGAIGIERSYKNRPAGFRTHILVTLGATLASLAGLYMCVNAGLVSDIARLGSAVVAGLGFIGAGTIIVTKNYTIKGLTTASGLWTAGVIGIALGYGYYEGAVITAALVLLAEAALSGIVNRIKRDPEYRIRVRFDSKPALDQVLRCCKNRRQAITNLQVVSDVADEKVCYCAFVTLCPSAKAERKSLFGDIEKIEGVVDFREVEMKE